MKTMKYFLHGIIFAAGCPIILYGHAISGATNAPGSVIRPVIFSITLYLLFLTISLLLLRKASAAGLIASTLIVGILYLSLIFILILSVTLLGILILFIVRKKVRLAEIHLILNVTSILTVGFYLFQFVGFVNGIPWNRYRTMTQKFVSIADVQTTPQSTPDIYYIILDEYGRADMLQNLYGYDNSGFINSLEQRGFVVPPDSRSNYMRTLLSLSSSLNMQYLDTVSDIMGDSNLWWPLTDIVQHSAVRTLLEKNGYQTVFFATGWDFTDIRDGTAYEKPYQVMLKNFDEGFILQTNLRYLDAFGRFQMISFPSFDSQRKIILNNFTTLPEIANLKGPKFVFTHIVAPHPPFVFDEAGRPIDPAYGFSLLDIHDEMNTANYIQKYVAQMEFVNQKTLETIDAILRNSQTPPIIIIQGDHGPDALYDFGTLADSCFDERTSILNAYYLPGVKSGDIPDDISPVDSFRFVFNQYFKTDFEYLPSRQYFSTDDQLYHFIDVTDRAGSSCKTP